MSAVGDTTPDGQGEGLIAGLEIRLLGPVEVTRGGCLVRLPGAKPTALPAMLAIHAGEVVGSGRLIDALWETEPPPSAGAVLRTYVAQLRRALAAPAIVTGTDGYALRRDATRIDAQEFEVQIGRAPGGAATRR